jgi:hypothetical protein
MRPLSTRRSDEAGTADQATTAGAAPVGENGASTEERDATRVTTEIQAPPAPEDAPTRVDMPQVTGAPDPLAAAAGGPGQRGKLRRRLRRLKGVRARQRTELGTLVVDARKRSNGSRPEVVERRAAEAAEVERQVAELQHVVDPHADTRALATGVAGGGGARGTLLSTEDRFCPNCGAPTKAGRKRPEDTSPVAATPAPAAAPTPAASAPPPPADDGALAHVDRSAIPPPPPPPTA